MTKKRIAILASGSGSNAQRITEYFADSEQAEVALILSNRTDAYVLERARKLNVPSRTFNRHDFYDSDEITRLLQTEKIDLVVLAGFLWLVPQHMLCAFPNRIINIHPALLPKFGGKGMFGTKVHEAVIAAREAMSGITIHFVNEVYDSGEHILQVKAEIHPEETPESLAEKIHQLEYEFFPKTIESVLDSL